MNAFTHPTESAKNSPHEVIVTKRIAELSKSKSPVERVRQFDYIEFADETRVANVMIFEAMHSKLTAMLGQDCTLVFVKRENFGKAKSEDGFDFLHYLVAIQTNERTYAVDLNFTNKAIAELKKIIRNEYIAMVVCIAVALLSLPGILILIGFFTLPISLMIIFVGQKGLRERKLQLLTFEKILAVSSSFPSAIRHEF
jgi:ABC-type multidrug transport system fused ATPase/permease subunit